MNVPFRKSYSTGHERRYPMKKIVILVFILTFSAVALSQTGDFKSQILERHNEYRAKHNVPPLTWNEEIARFARQWAERLAREDRMYHRSGSSYGENIYWQSGGTFNGNRPVDSWYSEIRYYRFSNHGFSYKTGHFTQVVWKGTEELGCGKAQSSSGGVYVVCNYSPPGNYKGRFQENVPPPSGSGK
jgi:uncharacterized protein YkwD